MSHPNQLPHDLQSLEPLESRFPETINEPTPFSNGRPVKLQRVKVEKYHAEYKCPEGTLYQVDRHEDGRLAISYH